MWTDTFYLQFPDRDAALAAAAEFGGVHLPMQGPDAKVGELSISGGNENYALMAPILVPAAGSTTENPFYEPGFWAMLRLSGSWSATPAVIERLAQLGVSRDIAAPPVVFAAGD